MTGTMVVAAGTTPRIPLIGNITVQSSFLGGDWNGYGFGVTVANSPFGTCVSGECSIPSTAGCGPAGSGFFIGSILNGSNQRDFTIIKSGSGGTIGCFTAVRIQRHDGSIREYRTDTGCTLTGDNTWSWGIGGSDPVWTNGALGMTRTIEWID